MDTPKQPPTHYGTVFLLRFPFGREEWRRKRFALLLLLLFLFRLVMYGSATGAETGAAVFVPKDLPSPPSPKLQKYIFPNFPPKI